MAGEIRSLAREALELHRAGKHAEALGLANRLARANPGSALALNLLGILHLQAGGAARHERAPGRGAASAYALASSHFGAAGEIRSLAREALELHRAGKHAEALGLANRLARANPGSALALNLLGILHLQAGGAARHERAPGRGAASAYALASSHFGAALGAFSAAAQAAPNCVLTASFHARELAAQRRFADAQLELLRVLSPTTNHDDPEVNHVVYDVVGRSTRKQRKRRAVTEANALLEDVTTFINNEIVPREARKLLHADAAVDQVRSRAKRLSEAYPYSVGAQLLPVYIELEQVHAHDLISEAVGRRRLLCRSLDLISRAAGNFDSSLLIALFHAKVLFALNDFDGSERECRRALRIQVPSDTDSDDIPPAISVPGADYDDRVSSLRKQLLDLLEQVIDVVSQYWNLMKSTEDHDMVTSVRVDTMQEHYNEIDQSAAKTIRHALRFLKKHNSWSFLVCPNSCCDGKKFMNTVSLCEHMRREHQDELWKKLVFVLGPVLFADGSKADRSWDGINLCQDSGQNAIFSLPRIQVMLKSLLLSPYNGIQVEPLAEMRQRKRREGSEVFEDIKEKLKMLPEDVLSTEFKEFCFETQNLWLKFLETSSLDQRAVILPLATAFQWKQMKRSVDLTANDLGMIVGAANVDISVCKFSSASDRNVSEEPGSKPSHTNNIDHRSGDDLQTQNLQPSRSNEILQDGEKCEIREVQIVQRVLRLPVSSVSHIVNTRLLQMIRRCLQAMQYVSQDGEFAFNLGVRLSNVASNMMLVTDGLNEGSEYINWALPFLETYIPLLGEGPVAVLVRRTIDLLKYISQMMGTTGSVLAIGSAQCSGAGLHLQRRHPNAQTGGRETCPVQSIVTVRNVQEAEAIVEEWIKTKAIVIADVDEDLGSEEAKEIYNIFVTAGAHDLVRESSVLLSKMQMSDEPEWVIT